MRNLREGKGEKRDEKEDEVNRGLRFLPGILLSSVDILSSLNPP